MKKVSLKYLMSELEKLSDFNMLFLDTETNLVVEYYDEVISGIPNDFNPDEIKYIKLPDRRDIHEHHIMVKFAKKVSNDNQRSEMLDILYKKHAFKNFHILLDRFLLKDEYNKYYNEKVLEILIHFLKSQQVEFEE